MTINLIFKIAAVGIIVLILNQVLRNSGKDEYVSMINLAGLILVIFWILPYISELFETVKLLFSL
ncbi:MAG: stage sporulation protein [Clostridiales bacterium]|jgi:stage III sporulation protein AC|nr:stage sporulation protein [Clostridiales bacterium]